VRWIKEHNTHAQHTASIMSISTTTIAFCRRGNFANVSNRYEAGWTKQNVAYQNKTNKKNSATWSESSNTTHTRNTQQTKSMRTATSTNKRFETPMPQPIDSLLRCPKHFKIKTQLTRGLWRNSTIWLVQRGLYNKISTIGIMSLSSLIGSDRRQKRDTRGEWRFQ